MLGLAVAAWCFSQTASASEQQQPELVPLVPLAARYTLGSGAHRSDWYLVRTAARIETVNTGSAQNDIWEQSATQQYNYMRIYHADQRIVEYTPGELKARNVAPNWAQLASVVPPHWLAKLKRTGKKSLFGQTAVHYQGKVGQETVDLWWLEQSQLPARLLRSGPQGRMAMELKEIHAAAPATWPMSSEAQLARYGKIDASDFGDMESDPFVIKIQAQSGEGHGHAH